MQKNYYYIPFVLIGIVLFLVFYFYFQKSIEPAKIVSNNIEKEYYDMKIELPENTQENFPDIFSYTSKIISDFDKQFEGLTEGDIKMLGFDDGRKWELFISTKVATSSKTVSYIVESYAYTGGAHGGTSIKVFNYNNKNILISENDIFSDKDWRVKISNLAEKKFRESLGEYLNEDMLKSGLEPKVSNFKHFYLEGDFLVFLFDEYSIGPYVIGIQKFAVLKSEIQDIISDDYK